MYEVPRSVLVVGASAAGLSTVEALRRKGFTGQITVLGDERHPPYDRPPLSKQVLDGHWAPERALLRDDRTLAGLGADFVLGDAAVALDPRSKTVRTAAGRTLSADAVVVATGARARTLPGQHELDGVHSIRTLEDAVGLRSDLLRSSRLVVVGDGVLGAETAATARTMGLDVTLTGPMATPMLGQLGRTVSGRLARLHTDQGVRLRLGATVDRLLGDNGRVSGVLLANGDVLPADVVVVAVGSVPATGWLAGSGLDDRDGLLCDPLCRAADGVYAVGDVARVRPAGGGAPRRLENRTNATEQAGHVAGTMLGGTAPYQPVPYFWTDQYSVKIQVHGTVPPDGVLDVLDGHPDEGRFCGAVRHDGRVAAVVGWQMPKQVLQRRRELEPDLRAALAEAAR